MEESLSPLARWESFYVMTGDERDGGSDASGPPPE
jgi:hypothetical protein